MDEVLSDENATYVRSKFQRGEKVNLLTSDQTQTLRKMPDDATIESIELSAIVTSLVKYIKRFLEHLNDLGIKAYDITVPRDVLRYVEDVNVVIDHLVSGAANELH